jgi:FkbM family methyltransferase
MQTSVTYYSQNGEDALLHRMFPGKTDGVFVEVGCIDGLKFSNTYVFEQLGWTGVCIEAHQGYIDALRRNRPRSQVFACAVGPRDAGEVTFHANAWGSLSTVDAGREDHFRDRYPEYFEGFEAQSVPMQRIDTILERAGVGAIDILSLDIEGYEIEALKGMTFERFRPRVMVVEFDTPEGKAALDQRLLPVGYTPVTAFYGNAFYTTESALAAGLPRFFRADLLHTPIHTETGPGERVKRIVYLGDNAFVRRMVRRVEKKLLARL